MRAIQSPVTSPSIFPSIDDVTMALKEARRKLIRHAGEDAVDVRLQVTDSGWSLGAGLSAYGAPSLGHGGGLGVGAIHKADRVKDLRNLAKDLLRQARDHFFDQF